MRHFKIEQFRYSPLTDDLEWLPCPKFSEPFTDLSVAVEYAESIPDSISYYNPESSYVWTMGADAFYSNKLIRIKFYENTES